MEFNGHASPDGKNTFWLDPVSGASVWERPEAYAWAETPSVEHPGKAYYFNSVRRAPAPRAAAARRLSRRPRGTRCFWHGA